MNINRRQFLFAAAAGPALAALKHPNVVIFLADDLGTADVSYRGGEIDTPNIDKLAAEGLKLERMYSFPVCSPTRSATMTGRSPMRLGVIWTVIRPWETWGVPVEEHFMPQSFKAAGYQTAMTGKWHLGHSKKAFLPNARGFDHSYGHVNGALDYYTHMRDGGLDWHRDGKALKEDGYTTDLLANEAIRLIKARDKSKPMFLYMPFNAPHTPLQAPQPLIDKYAKRVQGKQRATFAAMVEKLDEAIGRVVKTLDAEGMTSDTLVLFYSDNGGPVNQGARNTPLRGAKASTWEGGIRVPGVVRWPSVVKPGTSKQFMTAMDVFPTLAEAAGVAPRNKRPFDGRSQWKNLLAGSAQAREDIFFAVGEGETQWTAVFHNEWKLVMQGEKPSLFKIEADPEEKTDLAAKHPAVVKDLIARIAAWKKLHPAKGGTHPGPQPEGWKAPASYIDAAT